VVSGVGDFFFDDDAGWHGRFLPASRLG
jgi:hypothetical protein